MAGRRIVFVPGWFTSPEGAEVFADAPDLEVVYGLDEQHRASGRTPEGAARARELMQEALARYLPTVSALHAIGVGAQLPVTAQDLRSAERLEVVFVPSAGTDNVDLAAATEVGIAVVNAAGSNYASVAEHAVGLLLALTRRIAVADRVASGQHRLPSPGELPGGRPTLLAGRTVGILGFGFIGRALAETFRLGFGMRVLAYDPFFDPTEARRQGVTMVEDLRDLLPACDVVSVNAPLTPGTRGLVGADELALMKPSAVLLNTSRGGTVDTEALVAALREGRIAAAGLDVTDPEPLPEGHPLFDFPNVVLTPHLGGVAGELLPAMATSAARGALRALRGQRPYHLVNPGVWPAFQERQARLAAAAGAREGS